MQHVYRGAQHHWDLNRERVDQVAARREARRGYPAGAEAGGEEARMQAGVALDLPGGAGGAFGAFGVEIASVSEESLTGTSRSEA